MSRLLGILERKRLALVVSLPENRADLAAAAVRGGADALKVHINLVHQAAGTKFGTFTEERKNLEEIIKASTVPVGLVPGDEKLPDEKEFEEIQKLGFDFIDIRLKRIPPWMKGGNGVALFGAVDPDYSLDDLTHLASLGLQGVEAAVVPHDGYGDEGTGGDLQKYIDIVIACNLPVIVPSQKKIAIPDIGMLKDTRVKGVMIGAIVTGKSPETVEYNTRFFRRAIEALNE